MARTFHSVAPRTSPTSTIRQFWGSLRHGEGRGGGCWWEWGVDGANFPFSCSADGPYFDNSTILGVPPAWGREGWEMLVGVGSGWRELSIQLLRGRALLRQFDNSGGPSGMGKGGGGCWWEWGVDGANFPLPT